MTIRAVLRPCVARLGLVLALAAGPVLVATAPTPVAAQVSLNLRDADLRSFVEIVSEATGRRFVLDPGVRGTVTVMAPGTMTPAELYEVFLAVLELNRLTVIDGAGVDRIVQMGSARELASGPAALSGEDGAYESRVIQLQHISTAEIVEVVPPAAAGRGGADRGAGHLDPDPLGPRAELPPHRGADRPAGPGRGTRRSR